MLATNNSTMVLWIGFTSIVGLQTPGLAVFRVTWSLHAIFRLFPLGGITFSLMGCLSQCSLKSTGMVLPVLKQSSSSFEQKHISMSLFPWDVHDIKQ